MNHDAETKIRNSWVDQLWQRKNYDSPAEFMEHSYCFACGMTGALKARSVSGDSVTQMDSLHLLCGHCHTDSRGLKGFSYLRWFLNRTAADTIAAEMFKKTYAVSR